MPATILVERLPAALRELRRLWREKNHRDPAEIGGSFVYSVSSGETHQISFYPPRGERVWSFHADSWESAYETALTWIAQDAHAEALRLIGSTPEGNPT